MKEIPELPKEKWLRAFAMAVNIAIEKDYFSDLLESYLYLYFYIYYIIFFIKNQ